MKKLVKIGIVCFSLIFVLFSTNLVAYAEAEGGETSIAESSQSDQSDQSGQDDGSMDVGIGIVGDNPNVDIDIEGDNPNVNIDVTGEQSDVYINDRNIEIPTVVNNSYHESHTTVVQGVSISDVKGEIDKNLTPLTGRTLEVERGLTLAIDGLSKVILMIGNPNELPSNITDALNKIISDLSKTQKEVTEIRGQLEKINALIAADKNDSLKRDDSLLKDINKIQTELKKISDWSDVIAKTIGDDRTVSLEQDAALAKDIKDIQAELKKISDWSAEIVKSIDEKNKESIARDNDLLAKADKIQSDLKAEVEKRNTEIQILERDRNVLFYALASLALIMIIMMIMIIRLMRLRKKAIPL